MENPKFSISCERYAKLSKAERLYAWQVLLTKGGHWPMDGLPVITTDHSTHKVVLELFPFGELNADSDS